MLKKCPSQMLGVGYIMYIPKEMEVVITLPAEVMVCRRCASVYLMGSQLCRNQAVSLKCKATNIQPQ